MLRVIKEIYNELDNGDRVAILGSRCCGIRKYGLEYGINILKENDNNMIVLQGDYKSLLYSILKVNKMNKVLFDFNLRNVLINPSEKEIEENKNNIKFILLDEEDNKPFIGYDIIERYLDMNVPIYYNTSRIYFDEDTELMNKFKFRKLTYDKLGKDEVWFENMIIKYEKEWESINRDLLLSKTKSKLERVFSFKNPNKENEYLFSSSLLEIISSLENGKNVYNCQPSCTGKTFNAVAIISNLLDVYRDKYICIETYYKEKSRMIQNMIYSFIKFNKNTLFTDKDNRSIMDFLDKHLLLNPNKEIVRQYKDNIIFALYDDMITSNERSKFTNKYKDIQKMITTVSLIMPLPENIVYKDKDDCLPTYKYVIKTIKDLGFIDEYIKNRVRSLDYNKKTLIRDLFGVN